MPFPATNSLSTNTAGAALPRLAIQRHGAVAFGGGIDVRSGSWLGLRGELRDVITGARRFAIPLRGECVQNVAATIGVVVRL